jgi:ribosome-associated protein
MDTNIIQGRNFFPEFTFSSTRSSGAGGQNVNKVNTKVELRFHVDNSALLTGEEKVILHQKLINHITSDGFLVIRSQKERSQVRNKEITIDKFYMLLIKALTPRKKRKATQPSKASIKKRLEVKRQLSEIKTRRQKTHDYTD